MSPDAATVTKLNGAPGAGKTTTLLQHVEEEREQGVALGDLYYLTFTRSGRSEAADRLGEVFSGADRDDIDKSAKTVHGAACTTCLLEGIIENPGEQIIQPGSADGAYAEFCEENGLSYTDEKVDPLRQQRDGDDLVDESGNQLFAAYNWLMLTRKPYEKVAQSPVTLPMPDDAAIRLFKKWDAFKQSARDRPLFEHTDYVDEVIDGGLTPPASVLFVDEFQDLSPQEYLLIKSWRDSGAIDQLYIAGDVNQSIYSFRAARPIYLAETDVDDVESRTASYRCPAEVVSVARGILEACDETDPNGFQARQRGGTVTRDRFDDAAPLADAIETALATHDTDETGSKVFLLTRTNRQVGTLMRALEEGGIPYSTLGAKAERWDDPLPQLLTGLRAVQSGKVVAELPTAPMRTLDAYYPSDTTQEETLKRIASLPVDEVVDRLDLDKSYNTHYDKRRLKNALASGADNWPTEVQVGTIHAAKGLEAPCVFLFDAYTSTLRERYHRGEATAEEHRLYYVGASRASETLNVVTFDPLGGEVFPPFASTLPTAPLDEVVA